MNKLDSFRYIPKGKKTIEGIVTEIYTFRCDFNNTYILEVELFPKHSIEVIKYYLKNHRHSEDRYGLTNEQSYLEKRDRNQGKTGATNCLKILNTIKKLMVHKIKMNKQVSFAFMGAPKLKELDKEKNGKNINADGTVRNTQRSRVYENYLDRYFDPKTFLRRRIASTSSYMVSNVANTIITDEIAEKFLNEYIVDHA